MEACLALQSLADGGAFVCRTFKLVHIMSAGMLSSGYCNRTCLPESVYCRSLPLAMHALDIDQCVQAWHVQPGQLGGLCCDDRIRTRTTRRERAEEDDGVLLW